MLDRLIYIDTGSSQGESVKRQSTQITKTATYTIKLNKKRKAKPLKIENLSLKPLEISLINK